MRGADKNPKKKHTSRYLWQVIFFCFVLAGLTGVLFRLGMIVPLPGGLSLQNIRHAHSHLMFFGWAAALPLYLMMKGRMRTAAGDTVGFRSMGYALWGMVLFGLLSYPFFLMFGYRPVPVGDELLPLSVIFSGLVMVCWYVYIGGYLSIRKKIEPGDRKGWFEAALLMLGISSLGAWGVAVAQMAGESSPLLEQALTHFFLSCFTEGWVVLGTVALLDKVLQIPADHYPFSPGALAAMILLGAPLTFSYGISETMLSSLMLNAARAGGLAAGTGLLLIGYAMVKSDKARRSIWIWPVALLVLKGSMQVTASVIPSGFWFSDHGLRIFYLHVLLLGLFTLTGIGYLHTQKKLSKRSFMEIVISILIVLISLLLLTQVWPVSLGGMWIYYAVTGAALLPVIAVMSEWWVLRAGRSQPG